MKRIEPRRLKGFRDYLPEPMAARLQVMDVIRKEAALAGFAVIATPALEYQDTLLGQGGDETDKQVYRFKDHGDRDVALRFDLTVPFARFVAEHQGELTFPFKKLQMGDVWRGENTQKGRYREFCQCDLDIIGVDGAAADIEILSAFQRILAQVDCGPFTQGVGHRVVLSGLIRKIAAIGPEHETEALIILDKLAKIGRPAVLELLRKIPGVERGNPEALLDLITAKDGAGDTDLGPIAKALAGDEAALVAVERLRTVVGTVRRTVVDGPGAATGGGSGAAKGGSKGRIVADLTLARGLAYYTGIVFETTLDAMPGFGSVSSGGRYNDLASRFTTRELPGVGGSIGLDRLLAGLEEMGKVQGQGVKPVLIAVATDDALGYAFELAGTLRAAGLAAEVGLVPKLGNQFKYADRRGSPYVLTVGTTEKDERTYSLKELATGAETRGLPATGIADELRRRL